MNKILYVHKDESIAYLIDRIENHKDDDVYLNIDDNLELFSDPTNVKLLKREADFLGKNIILVSDDADIISFAENSGFDSAREEDVLDFSNEEEYASDKKPEEKEERVSFLESDEHTNIISDIKQPDFLKNKNQSKKYDTIDVPSEKEVEYDKRA